MAAELLRKELIHVVEKRKNKTQKQTDPTSAPCHPPVIKLLILLLSQVVSILEPVYTFCKELRRATTYFAVCLGPLQVPPSLKNKH